MKRKRRENHTVHTYLPPKSHVWWIRYTHDGKQHRLNTGFADEGQARIFAAKTARMLGMATSESLDEKKRLLEIAEDLIKGIRELEGKGESLGMDKNLPSVRQWFNRRLDEMSNGADGDDRHVKQSSLLRIQNVHDRWLNYLEKLPLNLADSPISRVGPDEVKGFLADGKKQGLSGSTRRYALARIRAVFGRAVDMGLLSSNPAGVKRIGRLKFDAVSIRRSFNTQQIAAVLGKAAQSSEKWLYLSAMLALFTGQRAGDVCAMRWEDVKDLDGLLPTIAVTQQKTGNAIVIPLAEPLCRILRTVPKTERTGYLLGDKIAAAYIAGRRRNFNRGWRDLLNAVNLADLAEVPMLAKVERSGTHGRTRYAWSFHSFRHTCASRLSGPDAHFVLGHRGEDEKRLGQTAQYRWEDLARLKKQLDAIPIKQAENVVQLSVNAQ